MSVMDQDVTAQFWRDGYVVARGLLSPSDIANARAAVLRCIERDEPAGRVWESFGARGSKGDLLTHAGLRDLLFDHRILGLVRQLLGGDPVYFGDSSFQMGEGARGWHRDNRASDRHVFSGDDWKGRYPIIRIGVYLQDHKRQSGGLGVRRGSHEPSRIGKLLSRKLPFITERARLALLERVAHAYGRAILVDSEPGDVVAWNLRTVHTGNSVKLRIASHLKVPPILEQRIPRALRIVPKEERCACFASFGLAGQHLTNYLDYQRSRSDVLDHWLNSRFGEEVWRAAREQGLQVIRPIDEYGTPRHD